MTHPPASTFNRAAARAISGLAAGSSMLGAIALSLCLGSAARAESVTYAFTGKTAILPAPVVPFAVSPGYGNLGIKIGDAVSGSFTYLTGGTDASPSPAIGNYAGNLKAMSVTIGSRTWTLAATPISLPFIQIDDDWQLPNFLPINPGYFSDKFTAAGDISGPAPTTALGSPLAFTLGLDLSSQTLTRPNPLFSDTLIPSTLNLGAFTALHQGIITYSFIDADNRVVSEGIRFDITALATVSAVPEPGTVVLLLSGLGILALGAAVRAAGGGGAGPASLPKRRRAGAQVS